MAKRKALTEAEWLSGGSTPQLLRDLKQHRGAARTPDGRRRLRLFACACCREVWDAFADEEARRAVGVAERHADGQAGREELEAARLAAEAAGLRPLERIRERTGGRGWMTSRDGPVPPDLVAAHRANGAAMAAAAATATGDLARAAENAALLAELADSAGKDPWKGGRPLQHVIEGRQCALLRDIFGNPFRPVTVGPAWQTAQVVAVAKAAYDQRELPSGQLAPERLAVLADALEEGGCTGAELLGHLRGAGPHVRGCWAVDLLLGKE